MTRLLGISGALRKGSTNTMLVREAARLFAPDHFEMADLRLPLYDADLEAEGMPDAVIRLCDQIRAADAIVISTPEYNKAPPGVLKNALDWVSRVRPMATQGKPVAPISAAAGMAGGQRATSALYLMLIPFGVRMVTAPEVSVGNSSKKFDDAGRLTDEAAEKFLRQKMEALRAAI
ncbi:NAD(P)H-dependent oxidoreductase [Limibaculum sp. M0105]|uniref:NAD(P)H-dependent oxidoreductase n=1 Tax=Thermohalobaculum xanthum TaxID=2753746 RepID=A0A8J7MAU4_9RHOB|nr:NAD(P)H-dependent oxidoreductase [Thermohalobaculum xanthum]MBK0400689.1 NAD(P)H-dependent oxidoreductase [Thermohalobaculum xanthum]